ncbi:hypothetical protein [Dysgonomonas sp. Marseille-P4361]|uniref:hypothetical protein n=1 Tax=Dysgonomonas sp. Marseille-P4361 TaxID=2161820 RepID=UPI0013598A6F|nr:hypothetical protein [Dysgonomonas sp. Marseille-P4361]
MKKNLTLLFILGLTLLTACSNDEPDGPIKPEPPVVVPTEDALLGTWETYYYEKQITVNPGGAGGQERPYQGLRYIDYDGFRSSFVKENGKYIAKDYNLAGNLAFQADFHIKDDTIKYARADKTEDGRDTIIRSWQRVREFNPEKGILMIDQSYYGTTKNDDTWYKITDVKTARNIKTAPTTTEGVTPKKHMIDFDDLCKGKWQIYLFREYENGKIKEAYSIEMTTKLQSTSFKFYVNDKGNKRCIMTEWNDNTEKLVSIDYPVLLIDDVVHLLYKEEVKDEEGNVELEDASIFLWVTSWGEDKTIGSDNFIDYKKSRYAENISITVETKIYIKRILE